MLKTGPLLRVRTFRLWVISPDPLLVYYRWF